MRRRVRLIVVVLVLLVAACGGGGEGDDTTTTVSPGEDDVTTTTVDTTTTQAVVSANADDDFCQFIVQHATEFAQQFNVMNMTPEEIEDAFRTNLDAINQAGDLAPNDIRSDVELFAQAYGGFIDFLEEYDFNFLAFPENAEEDPRLQALEDPELEAAGNRIEEYCGIDEFIASSPTAPGDGGGGTGGIPGSEAPEDFPAELEPPGGNVVASVTAGGANSVTFDTGTPADDVIAYYTDVLGLPVQEMESPKGALWTTNYDGVFLNLVVSEVGDGITQVNVTLGG